MPGRDAASAPLAGGSTRRRVPSALPAPPAVHVAAGWPPGEGIDQRAPLALEIGLPVIEDLGIKLYGKLPPVVSEIVANSWDADAKRVEIRLPEGPVDKGSTITVADDGTGMSYDDIAKRYLRIGRKRRDEDGTDRSAGGGAQDHGPEGDL